MPWNFVACISKLSRRRRRRSASLRPGPGGRGSGVGAHPLRISNGSDMNCARVSRGPPPRAGGGGGAHLGHHAAPGDDVGDDARAAAALEVGERGEQAVEVLVDAVVVLDEGGEAGRQARAERRVVVVAQRRRIQPQPVLRVVREAGDFLRRASVSVSAVAARAGPPRTCGRRIAEWSPANRLRGSSAKVAAMDGSGCGRAGALGGGGPVLGRGGAGDVARAEAWPRVGCGRVTGGGGGERSLGVGGRCGAWLVIAQTGCLETPRFVSSFLRDAGLLSVNFVTRGAGLLSVDSAMITTAPIWLPLIMKALLEQKVFLPV